MEYQRCTRCVMDNAIDDTITFDKNGHCNYCNDVRKRMPNEYCPDGKMGGEKLKEIINTIKRDCKDDKYDCIVGVSGGIDSSYIMYLGYKYGLRMMAVHIDDGLDNPIATENLKKLINATGCDYRTIEPQKDEYADLLYALLKASVSNLAIAQDNLIIKALQDFGEDSGIKYILDGYNFAHESILERNSTGVNPCDKKFIEAVHRRFGRIPLKTIKFISLTDRYIKRHTNKGFKHIRPLNYIDYRLEDSIKELNEFCGFEYYGGKHYESILTRFMQCYYLPDKFGLDKRKSHFSSLIMSGQMTREEALKRLEQPLYPSSEMFEKDKKFLSEYMGITLEEMEELVAQAPIPMTSYPHSRLNEVAPIARKLRKILE